VAVQAISLFEPAAVELGTSRGYETPSSKLLMRMSVVASDTLFLIPAALLACQVFTTGRPHQ
jgi:alpha-1,3-glucosyltransferase